ncbi:MAG: Fic/DOC family N-terminal domain-containing protein [bacterium]|nr:Fic/DOC family N-terminal domain-containing protein [bacterium]
MNLSQYSAGSYEKGYQYKYFVPTRINSSWEWSSVELNHLLEKSAVKLGELNACARLVPDINLFIQLHVTKEAVLSSRIEGTQTNIDEALLPEEEINPERRNDWKEVHNYITALNLAIQELRTLPISSRLLKQVHRILLDSVRGQHKMPGEFRTSQNWIGGASLADATFIPPHPDLVPDLMTDLEMFIHNDELQLPELIRIAIAHYQFETIHPFLDGNGRIGRLLITLFLVSVGMLEQPLLYLSVFFERNKHLYYDNLTFVRTKNDMMQWIKYFLVGVEQTATDACDALKKIIELKLQIENLIQTQFGRRSSRGYVLLQHLFKHPFINIEQAAKVCQVNYGPANELIALMCRHNILKETTGQSRNRMFVFKPYLDVFREGDL